MSAYDLNQLLRLWTADKLTAEQAVGQIIQQVQGGDSGYLSRLAWKLKPNEVADSSEELSRTRHAILRALAEAAHGNVPIHGPRGGLRWTARYFARRVAWHVLDHAWEIEDRIM